MFLLYFQACFCGYFFAWCGLCAWWVLFLARGGTPGRDFSYLLPASRRAEARSGRAGIVVGANEIKTPAWTTGVCIEN